MTTSPLSQIFAISAGAALGACARWALTLACGQWLGNIPLSTLWANWLGAFAAGMVFAALAAHADVSPLWRLLLMTGFLGGLTTFSAFSLEAAQLLRAAQYASLALHMALHVLGCLLLTLAGMWAFDSLWGTGAAA